MLTSLPQLVRKLSTKIENGHGVRLSPDELELLVRHDAYSTICVAAAEIQKAQCQDRNAQNQSTNGALTRSTPAQIVPISKSSGTISDADVSAASARAQAITKKAS